jgi:hypothetical protein
MEIIDDVLSGEDLQQIKDSVFSNQFPWYYTDTVSFAKDKGNDPHFYFTHLFYHKYMQSNWFSLIDPIQTVINPDVLIRAKANMYPKTPKLIHHKNHIDYNFEHKGAIFYVNTNDGLTVLSDGTEIENIENRLLLFDSSLEHHSTSCTNVKCRLNININYI